MCCRRRIKYLNDLLRNMATSQESFPVGDKRTNRAMTIWGDPGSRTLGLFFLEMVLFLLIMFLVGGVGRKGNSLQSVFK